MKRLIRDEKGQALILVLILLLVSGLIIAPLLAYMGSGLIAGRVYEKRTAELYAADAGVEDAVWKIQHQAAGVWNLTKCYPSTNYTITNVNGKDVTVTITYLINEPIYPTYHYRVVSTATGDGSGTQIEAYVASVYGDYSGITNHVITSQGEIDLKKVSLDCDPENEPAKNYTGPWPTADELAQYYWRDVEDGTHYYGVTEIDLKGNNCPPWPIYINGEAVDCPSGLGPLYIDVDGELDITSSISTKEATLTLNGTLYITGDTKIYGPTATEPYKQTLDLNGQTIFVDGALDIERCTIEGPGVIIAIGDVYFAPNPDVGGEGEPVFVMSVSGTTTVRPGINMYGAIAGSLEVEI
ncbi:MAG: hypothetical protein J7L92_05640, partial [Dehalococcoidia bacterium]|nr:hypothetical protein [Dehalococcoidia bacterium]